MGSNLLKRQELLAYEYEIERFGISDVSNIFIMIFFNDLPSGTLYFCLLTIFVKSFVDDMINFLAATLRLRVFNFQ